MSVPHLKAVNIVWTFVNNNIIDENDQYKDIGLCEFGYKLSEEEEEGGLNRD